MEVTSMRHQDVIVVKGQAGEAMSATQATLFVYNNKFKDILHATISLEICARQVIYTKTKYNYQTSHTLSLPAVKARTVQFYSNKP
jgi:hypothetical protein